MAQINSGAYGDYSGVWISEDLKAYGKFTLGFVNDKISELIALDDAHQDAFENTPEWFAEMHRINIISLAWVNARRRIWGQ